MLPVSLVGRPPLDLMIQPLKPQPRLASPGAFDISLPLVLCTDFKFYSKRGSFFSYFEISWKQLPNTHHFHFRRRKFRFRGKLLIIAQGHIDSKGHS